MAKLFRRRAQSRRFQGAWHARSCRHPRAAFHYRVPATGRGVRFTVSRRGETVPAFVVRFDGRVHGYLNRCAHRTLELDWIEGEYFDAFGEHLLCATHGARYAPASGTCVDGPCGGAGLVKLPVFEDGGDVYLEAEDDIHLVNSDGIP